MFSRKSIISSSKSIAFGTQSIILTITSIICSINRTRKLGSSVRPAAGVALVARKVTGALAVEYRRQHAVEVSGADVLPRGEEGVDQRPAEAWFERNSSYFKIENRGNRG